MSDNGTGYDNSWVPINLALLEDQPPVQPTLGDAGIVYPGKRHVFSGPQESAKTLAAYAIGLEVIRQGDPILLIDFEMGRWDARNRLRELGATPQELARISYIEPFEPAKPYTMNHLLVFDPALVIIDAAAGAYDLEGLDDNKRQDAEKIARLYIHTFWRAGIATIMLDHVVKQQGAAGKYAIGSERKTGGADVHLGFETIIPIQRGTHGLYKIVTHKDRGGFLQRGLLAHLELTSHPLTHAIEWKFTPAEPAPVDEPFRPTTLMERISRHLEKHHPEEHTRNQLANAVKGKKEFALKAIDALVKEGFAIESDGPGRSKLIGHCRLYRENDPEFNPGGSRTDQVVPAANRAESRASGTGSQVVPEPHNTPNTTVNPETGENQVVPGGSQVVPGTAQTSGSRSSPPLRGERPLVGPTEPPGGSPKYDPETERLLALYQVEPDPADLDPAPPLDWWKT